MPFFLAKLSCEFGACGAGGFGFQSGAIALPALVALRSVLLPNRAGPSLSASQELSVLSISATWRSTRSATCQRLNLTRLHADALLTTRRLSVRKNMQMRDSALKEDLETMQNGESV